MKTIRILFVAAGLICLATLSAQPSTQLPAVQMQSTSTLVSCGSSLPQAAVSGTYTTYDWSAGRPGMRRTEENPFGDDNVSGTETPYEPGTPIGDAALPLLLMAIGFGVYIYRKRKTEISL